jgi:hypothetical protein
MGVRHVAAEVTGLQDGGRTVLTSAGALPNDALLIATGGRFIKKLPGIEHAITPCEGIAAAEQIRDRLRALQGGTIAVGFAANPQEPQAVRGGPMFEFLFGIDTQLRREGRRDRFELVFFNPSPSPATGWARPPCGTCWPRWRAGASVPTWGTRCSASSRARWSPRAGSLRPTSSSSCPA